MENKHRWTVEEEEYCCKKYIEEFVIKNNKQDINTFVEELSKGLEDIKISSLKMKIQNIKQIMLEERIDDSLNIKGLKNYSKQNKNVMTKILKEYDLK